MGMLPETMLNFLALLGWSLDDKTEIFTRQELVDHFTLEQVNKSDAVWDADKLSWMNGIHIRDSSHERFAEALTDYWNHRPPAEFPEPPDRDFALKVGPLIQSRIKTLADAAPLLPFFFDGPEEYATEELVQRGMDAEGTRVALLAASEGLTMLAAFDTEALESLLRRLAETLDIKVGQLLGTMRVATTGLKVSPPIFETMDALGRDRTLSAIRAAIERLQPQHQET
jgi:glutamyl-tRNA synthetase